VIFVNLPARKIHTTARQNSHDRFNAIFGRATRMRHLYLESFDKISLQIEILDTGQIKEMIMYFACTYLRK
jgi:hypothetical protein